MSGVGHLARRFAGSLSPTRPDAGIAATALTPAELVLWQRFGAADQRHSLTVAARLLDAQPDAAPHEVAAALLHDIGKLDARLGTLRRVAATVAAIGDRDRRHRDHERLGAALLRSIGSDARTVAIVAGRPSPERARLEAADDV